MQSKFFLLLLGLLIVSIRDIAFAANTISFSSSPTQPGFQVNWTVNASQAHQNNFLGIYKGSAYVDWKYIGSCTQQAGPNALTSGSCTFDPAVPADTYQFRLMNPNGTVTLAKSQNVQLGTFLNPEVIGWGKFNVTWSTVSAQAARHNWVGVYPVGSSTYVEWLYLGSCTKSAPPQTHYRGVCTFTLPSGIAAGPYEIRLMNPNGSQRYALSALNHYPTPSHPIDFGYYYANERYGDHTQATFSYTNMYLAGAGLYDTSLSEEDRRTHFRNSLQKASDAGKVTYLMLRDLYNGEAETDLDDLAPFWSKVKYIELAHEVDYGVVGIEDRISRAKLLILQKGLSLEGKLFGVIEGGTSNNAPSVDFVHIEAYLNSSQFNCPISTCASLTEQIIDQKMSAVDSRKRILITMQAYDRNFLWTNIETLKTVQDPVYKKAYNNPRVIGITMFAYGRPGGALDHPGLSAIHKLIGAKILQP